MQLRFFRRLNAIVMLGMLGFGAASQAFAWGRLNEVGTSSASWLIQPSSARLLAMGGAGTADPMGVQGWWYNPAATAAYPYFSAEVSLRRQTEDTDVGFLSAAVPTVWGVPALGMMSGQTGPIQGYDATGLETAAFTTRTNAARFGWAVALGALSLGAAAEAFQEDLVQAKIQGLAADAGLLLRLGQGVYLGAACLHLGQAQSGNPLPSEARLGASAQLSPQVRAAMDVVAPRDAEVYLGAGLEWLPWPPLALRAGWRTGPVSSWHLDTLAYFSAGAGLNWHGFSLDYVFEPEGVLGESHHVSFSYHFSPAQSPAAVKSRPTPSPAPKPEAVPATAEPRLNILPRAYEGRMVFTPKTSSKDYQVRSLNFKVRDSEGKIVRTFAYTGTALPREIVWDGTDAQGRLVNQDKIYTFDFEYVTAQGVKTEGQTWPHALPARKLFFKSGGAGIEPGTEFRFQGDASQVKAWRLLIAEPGGRQPLRTFSGKGALPEKLTWDGKDEKGKDAPPNRLYNYRLELAGEDHSQAVIEHPIAAIPAEVIVRRDGRVKFKIVQILFNFAESSIRAEMADKIEKAAEIVRRRGPVITAIEGHADEIGTPGANLFISQKRAQAVKTYLEREAVPGADKIEVRGFGNKRILLSGQDDRMREQNRRVEILFDVPDPTAKPVR